MVHERSTGDRDGSPSNPGVGGTVHVAAGFAVGIRPAPVASLMRCRPQGDVAYRLHAERLIVFG